MPYFGRQQAISVEMRPSLTFDEIGRADGASLQHLAGGGAVALRRGF
jgi:hypothetical protein